MGKKKELKQAQLEVSEKILAQIETLVDADGSAKDIKNLAAAFSDIRSYF